jgi:O-antigen ligase
LIQEEACFSRFFFQRFKENPLFGTGIGSLSLSWQDIENYRSSFETFVIVNLKAGGHGTFLSLLYLFGLSGFIPFVLSLLFGIRTSFKLYKASQCNETLRSIALCCLLYLLNAIIPMLFGGSGSEPQYFVALGILSGTATEFALKRDSQPGFSTPVRIT